MNPQNPSLPWWRVPAMWLVIGGPAVVVIASFATLALALRGADALPRPVAGAHADAMAPATQARNRAASSRP